MAGIGFVGGLMSGLDTGSIIDAMVTAEKAPVNLLRQTRTGVQTQISKLGSIMSKLTALGDAAKDLSTVGGVLAYSASSSDESVFTANATGEAAAGSYQLDVTSLAVAEKDRSAVFTSKYAEVSAGTLTIQTPGADPVDVTIDAGDTLVDVVDKINGSGADVDASLIDTGSGVSLQVVAQQSGFEVGGVAADAITLTETTTGTSGQALGLSQITTATNAQFTIDGLAVEQRTNEVSTVLSGLTVSLKDTGAATLTVAKDTEGAQAKVQAFVDAFNDAMDLVSKELNVTEDTDRASSLSGDWSIRQLRGDLSSQVSSAISGLSGAYTSLSRIGITTEEGGKLALDATEFAEALDQDPGAVADLFTDATDGIAARFQALVTDYTDGTDGVLSQRKGALEDKTTRIDKRIDSLNDRIDRTTERLQAQFTAMELAMARIQDQSGAVTALTASLFGSGS